MISVNIDQADDWAVRLLKDFSWPYEVNFKHKAHGPKLVGSELFLKLEHGQKDISFSWASKLAKWQRDKSINANLLRALKLKKKTQVIDATMGLGVDTSYFLHHGIKVLGFERHPLLHFLLQGSLLLYHEDDGDHSALPLKIIYGQASSYLTSNGSGTQSFLPIYFDPMFDGGESRKAATKKEMSFLHRLVGASLDAKEEAEKLRALSSRLVIKRSPRMDELLDHRNSAWETKAVRFDLYL